MMYPLLVGIPFALLETAVFYRLHWPDRQLFPERFRKFLMAKGVIKSLTYIGITVLASMISPIFGWIYAIGHPAMGVVYHTIWCRKHGIDPITVQPRVKYVLASADWVNRLIALEDAKRKS